MPRIVVLDNLASEGLELLQQDGRIDVDVRTGLSGNQLHEVLAEYDGAICRSGVQLTADVLEGNRRLRAIVRAGVGTDNIDKAAATRLGIVVMNTPTGNTLSTAEHTIALMLALSRNIAPAHQSLVEGRWDRKKYMGAQVADKTLGIVGLGRIGQAVAARAAALEMRLLGYDPFLSAERAEELGIQLVDNVRRMLPEVDYLTVHTPLTDETRGLIGKDEIEMIKPGARVINCARGGIYDEDALLAGLQSKRLGGVALDVYSSEPCTESPLFGRSEVLCTPHLGASTEEAQAQVAVEAVHLIVNFLVTGEVRYAVNVSPLDAQTLQALRGFLDVAYRLGLLVAQFDCAAAKSCHLRFVGEVAERDTKLLSAAFACGLLTHALDIEPNVVNAELLLRERGIDLSVERRVGQSTFSSLIDAKLETGSRTHQASATLFGTNMPRLVQLGENRLDAYLDGTLLIFHHLDVPGIVGVVGTILGRHQVNIGQMAVGRAARGGHAIGVLNLDEPPPDDAVAEVREHEAISDASVVHLPPAGEYPSWLQGGI